MESSERFGGRSQRNLARYVEPSLLVPEASQSVASVLTWEQAMRILRKNGRYAILLAVVLTATITLMALSMKDVYQPVARLQIDPANGGIKTSQEIEEARITENPEYMETQAQILRSDGLAVSVIRELHLDSNPTFVGKSTLAKFGPRAKEQASQSGAPPASNVAFLQEQYDLAERTPMQSIALEILHGGLKVNPIRNSRLIEVSFSSHDPQLAQVITNTLVTQFIDQNYRHRYATTMQASEWLSTQLNDLRQKVQEANLSVANYQRQYGLVETDEHDVPLAQLMSEVNHQLSDAQANRIEAEAYVRMIDLGQSEAIPTVRDDQVYQNLMTRYADTRAQLAQARTIYGDENSNIKKLENEVNEFGAQVEAERQRMTARVRASYAAALSREEMMLAAREKLKAQMGDATSHMVAYRVLRNEALAKSELYNTLQARLKEAGIYAGLRSSNISVVDLAAVLPKPTGPHRTTIIAAGTMVSCMLAILFAFALESFNNTVRTPDDVRDWTGLPSLGMIPTMCKTQETERKLLPPATWFAGALEPAARGASIPKIILTKSHTAQAEAMRELRAALLFSKPGEPPRVILVSSSAANEGKTTIATNLATVLAERGKTCLVESDFRRPVLASALGLEPRVGLCQVLSGEASLEKALIRLPESPNLCLLPSGPFTSRAEDLIDSGHMKALVIALRDSFDFVVIDSPPVILFSDARVLATLADRVMLVGRYGLTTRRAITRCAQILDEVGAPAMGVVLNDIDLASPDYHYYNYGFSRNLTGKLEYYARAQSEASTAASPEPPKKRGAHA
jgi:succinoglycan biosynthesis transport protein ExoP